MLKTPLTRPSAERVRIQKARVDQVAENAKKTSLAVKQRKAELLKKGIPAAVLLTTVAYFAKRLLDRYRYHRKIEKFESARQHEAEGSVTMSAEELAAADKEATSGGLTVFDVLNAIVAAVTLFHRLGAATETHAETSAADTPDNNQADPDKATAQPDDGRETRPPPPPV